MEEHIGHFFSWGEWIDLDEVSCSSNWAYLPCSVTIASILANRLCQIARDWQDWQASPAGPSPAVRLRDIQAENVAISYLDPPQPGRLLAGDPEIKADFQGRKSGADIYEVLQSADDAIFLNSRQACSALGEILLEIFTRGRSRSSFSPVLMETVRSSASSASSGFPFSLELGQNSEDSKLAPASKRSTTSEDDLGRPAATKRSLEAKKLLRDMELPISICRLVSDLLDSNCSDILRPDSAFQSLEDVQSDLNQMKDHPELFLFDRICPDKALEDSGLFQQDNRKLYGREREMEILMSVARRVSPAKSSSPCDFRSSEDEPTGEPNYFAVPLAIESLCEAVFISGHSGSGKSSLVSHFIQAFRESEWFILSCKFDHQSASLITIAKSFDAFFQQFADLRRDDNSRVNFSRRAALDRVARSIITSIDDEGLLLLTELIPNLCHVLSLMEIDHGHDNCKPKPGASYSRETSPKQEFFSASATSITKVGSSRHRLHYLFRMLAKSLCSGNSVLFVLDDLQWADDLTLEVVGNFIYTGNVDSHQGKMLLLGTYRDNEVSNDSNLANQMVEMEKAKDSVNVTKIPISQLSTNDINQMLSFGLCLPVRLTRGLARLVHHKTRGNPLFIVEFLKSIIQNKLLTFSVKSRQWIWDEDLVDLQMISNGVVGLLTSRFCELSGCIIETLKIASCFGSQVEEYAMMVLDSHFFAHDVMNSLGLAMNEGLVEKAGPIFAFSHDMIQKSIYELMPVNERMFLHKEISMILMKQTIGDDQSCIHCLAADQINICKNHVVLSPEERLAFVELNLSVGKHAVTLSSFEQAHSYIESGLSLLEDDHWENQYYLSLRLHELSVVLSFMGGKAETMSKRLTDILLNVKTDQDKLTANALFIKYLAFSGRYLEAVEKCLRILSDLGEVFQSEIQSSDVSSEIAGVQLLLEDVSKERIQALPQMTNRTKLNAMKFLTLLCRYSFICKPILSPLVASRIVKLTLQFGFCDDSIVGLVEIGKGLIDFAKDVSLANRVGIVAESLIKQSPNKHTLRAKLGLTLYGFTRPHVDPAQSFPETFLDCYKSGMLAGDVESSMLHYFLYFCSCYYSGAKLSQLNRVFPSYLQEITKHQQYRPFYMSSSIFQVCVVLTGCDASSDISQKIGIKNHEELFEIAEQTNDVHLMFHIRLNELSIKFWMRDFIAVVTLSEKIVGAKRFLDIIRVFYEGIAALCLARDTKQAHWKDVGEKSIETISSFAKHSTWNFENKLLLLQAESYYANGDHDSAELFYECAIVSARKHRFLNEESLSQELFGIFLLENSMATRGLEHLRIAHTKYIEWGAMKKADAVKFLIDNASPLNWPECKWR